MKNLNLHSSGKRDYLNALKEKYEKLSFEIMHDLNLTEEKKEAALKKHYNFHAHFLLKKWYAPMLLYCRFSPRLSGHST